MTTREELESMPANELHDRATHVAWRRLDFGFVWDLLKTIPEARAALGDESRSESDIMEPIALLNDYVDADEGELAEALKPFYVDYLLKHGEEAGDGDRDDRDPGEGQREAGDADGAR